MSRLAETLATQAMLTEYAAQHGGTATHDYRFLAGLETSQASYDWMSGTWNEKGISKNIKDFMLNVCKFLRVHHDTHRLNPLCLHFNTTIAVG